MKTYIFFIIFFFGIVSCKRSNRTEIENQGKYKIEKIYRNDSLVASKTFENKILIWEAKYKNEKLHNSKNYYDNGKIKLISFLQKKPNHFTDVGYYKNGKKSSEGESDYFEESNTFLKRGGTIYYTKTGKIHEMMVFENDGKDEYLLRHTILDTLKDKILIDNVYDPPLTHKEYDAIFSR